ncbi:MAG: DUF1848 domain-containing protein [Lachnospiraceae bacterium]|nr:DUF1848 domain-containing protein [Lachnospiraceae bacterium]
MIISASRRTDIPAYFSEWFLNRIKEGYLYVRNPMNIHQISRIALTPDVVDCIVFWTKNPVPMLKRLDELKYYMYYFQFTLTGYGRDMIENLIGYKLKVGKDKVQRAECGCFESMEIGTYNTCRNGCKYCYANYSPETMDSSFRLYDPDSPLLCSPPVTPMDKITERKVKSLKGEPIGGPVQLSLFDGSS